MLTIGETFNQRKAELWSLIHSCQELLKVLSGIKGDNRKLALEVAKQEREIIKVTYAELKELQRWFKKSGLDENEPYQTPSQKAYWANLTDEQLEAELEKAEKRDMEILAIKERNKWE